MFSFFIILKNNLLCLQNFVNILKVVLGKKDPKDAYLFVCAPNDLWAKWLRIIENWRIGNLLNAKGEIEDAKG